MAVAAHIAEVMTAVRTRIKTLESVFAQPGLDVEIGHPASFSQPTGPQAKHLVTLFVYRIEPDHAAYLASPERGMAVKLRVMINVYAVSDGNIQESAGTTELRVLSEIMRLLMDKDPIGTVKVKDTAPIGAMQPMVTQGITVEAQQLSLDMEEINHIWTTQGDTPFRTALIYSFNYGVVAPKHPSDEGPPVLRTEMAKSTGPVDDQDMGIYPDLPDPEQDKGEPKLGALAFKEGAGAAAVLKPSLVTAPAPQFLAALLLVTEETVDFEVSVERFVPASGTWQAVPPAQVGNPPAAESRTITSHRRDSLVAGQPLPAATGITITAPSDGEIYRLSVSHLADPAAFSIGYVTLTVSGGN